MMLGLMPESNVAKISSGPSFALRDIVFILYRRRWTALVVALPIILIGGLSLLRQTGSFTAGSRVLVELTKVDLPQWNTTGRNIDYDRELSTLFNMAMSVSVAENAAEALRDSVPLIIELDPNIMGLDEPTWLRDYLLEGFDVSPVGESNILEFRFTSPHPRISLMAVAVLQEAFMDFQVHGRRNVQAIQYYEEQISLVAVEIDSLLNVRGNVMREYGYSSLKDELRNETGQIARMEEDLYRAITKRRTTEIEYNRLVSFLDQDPREFPMGPNESRSLTLVNWRNTVTQHEEELNNLLAIHTDESLPVQRQVAKLERSLQGLKKEIAAYVSSYEVVMLSARQQEESIRDQIDEIRRKSRDVPGLYQRVSLLDAEVKSLSDLMEDLQVKRGEVRISQMADERVSNVVPLTEPEMYEQISGGKTVIYLAMILLFAVALGIVVAFLQENLDHRVYVSKDVEANLKLPVFTTVTKVE